MTIHKIRKKTRHFKKFKNNISGNAVRKTILNVGGGKKAQKAAQLAKILGPQPSKVALTPAEQRPGAPRISSEEITQALRANAVAKGRSLATRSMTRKFDPKTESYRLFGFEFKPTWAGVKSLPSYFRKNYTANSKYELPLQKPNAEELLNKINKKWNTGKFRRFFSKTVRVLNPFNLPNIIRGKTRSDVALDKAITKADAIFTVQGELNPFTLAKDIKDLENLNAEEEKTFKKNKNPAPADLNLYYAMAIQRNSLIATKKEALETLATNVFATQSKIQENKEKMTQLEIDEKNKRDELNEINARIMESNRNVTQLNNELTLMTNNPNTKKEDIDALQSRIKKEQKKLS
jgi:hypothetical protein